MDILGTDPPRRLMEVEEGGKKIEEEEKTRTEEQGKNEAEWLKMRKAKMQRVERLAGEWKREAETTGRRGREWRWRWRHRGLRERRS